MTHSRLPIPKKSLSQVFLKVDWPGQWITDQLKEQHVVHALEIGPGPGILTKQLLDQKLFVTAIEKDDHLAQSLPAATFSAQEALQTTHHLKVFNQDILSFDLAGWLQQNQEAKAVVGNIPYKISSPILAWVLPHLNHLKCAIFLVQLEFAERVAAQANSKQYGSLSIFAQLRSQVVLGPTVEKSCFYPVPKVDSALIALKPRPHNYSPEQIKRCEELTKHMFSLRRKKLNNALKKYFPDPSLVSDLVNLDLRPENLDPETFMTLAMRSLATD